MSRLPIPASPPRSYNALTRHRLSPPLAFLLLASIPLSFLAGSSAPTPLYPVYQDAWAFSPVTVTVIFGVYAIAVLAALLVAGRLSDHVGRRPVLLTATAVQAATMIMFATADGLTDLLAARVIQGLSAGAALAAVGAGLLDLDKERGVVANAVAPALGTATGAVLAGVMVEYLPAPTHLIFYVLSAIYVVQGLGIAFMNETAMTRPGALASLRPQVALPPATRMPMMVATPALIASWALGGFYASLSPTLLRSSFGFNSFLIGGLALFVLAGSGATAIYLLRRYAPHLMLSIGTAALFSGGALVIMALSSHGAPAFFLGTIIAGAGFGTSFQGAIRTVVPHASATDRAGVLAVIFLVAYLAMGLPAISAGYLVAQGDDILTVAWQFSVSVMLLSAFALIGNLTLQAIRSPRKTQR